MREGSIKIQATTKRNFLFDHKSKIIRSEKHVQSLSDERRLPNAPKISTSIQNEDEKRKRIQRSDYLVGATFDTYTHTISVVDE